MNNTTFEYCQALWLVQNPNYHIIPVAFVSYVSDLHDVDHKTDVCRVVLIKEYEHKSSEIKYRMVRRSNLFIDVESAKNHILSSISFDLNDLDKKIKRRKKQLIEVSNKYAFCDDFEVFLKLKEFLKNERKSGSSQESRREEAIPG